MANTPKHYAINGRVSGHFPDNFDPMNRAFLLGDGFFESIRIIGGKPAFWDAHYDRIEVACSTLGMEMPLFLKSDFLYRTVLELLDTADIRAGGRLRITIFRDGRGKYFPETNRASYLMEVQPYFPGNYTVADRGAAIGVYRGGFRKPNAFSKFKMLGNHLSVSAAIWGAENRFDEVLLLSESGYISETTSGNVFVFAQGGLHTPPLSEGCVGGVMRMAAINAALNLDISVYESQLTEEDVIHADEVFITNAIKGITWVHSFRHKRYFHKISDRLLEGVRREVSQSN